MIIGQVNSFRQVEINVTVRDVNGQIHNIPATVDTGFSDCLSLSPLWISALGLPFVERKVFTLADGSDVEMRIFRVVIVWDGADKTILAVEAEDDSIVGMEMLDGFTLFIDATIGGEVRIAARP